MRTKFRSKKLTQKERLLMFNKLKKMRMNVSIDGLMSSVKNELHIDIMKLDSSIPNYDGKTCTYKGKPNYSLIMTIEEEYGKNAAEMVQQLI